MSDQQLAGPQGGRDEARLLQAAVHHRLSIAAADLALPERLRLSERQRSSVAALNAKLIRTIEDELRTHLLSSEAVRSNEGLAATFASAHVPVAVPLLENILAAKDKALVSTLVQRVDAHLRSRSRAAGEMPLLVELIGDQDPIVAEHAITVLTAQSRRVDSFDEPAAARTELPAELEHRLVWRVAAALRRYMIETHDVDPVAADKAIVSAAEQLLAGYDEGDSLEARAMRLARRLHETDRLTDQMVERTLSQGSLVLFLAALAVRASLNHAYAWEILSEPKGRGAVFLLKVASVERSNAAAILLMLSASEEGVSAQVDLFDATTPETAGDALRLWRVNPGLMEAIAELSQ